MDWFSVFVIVLGFLVCMRFAYEQGKSRQIAKQKKEAEIPNLHKDFVTILDVGASGQDATLYQTGEMIWRAYTLDTNAVRSIRLQYKRDSDVPFIDITPCEARQLSRALAMLGAEE